MKDPQTDSGVQSEAFKVSSLSTVPASFALPIDIRQPYWEFTIHWDRLIYATCRLNYGWTSALN